MGQKGINFLKEEIWGRHFNNLANRKSITMESAT
jgi:hypothetical protein